jgi:hypothetical protein
MHHVRRRKQMGRELKMKNALGSYEMEGIMLDLGFDLNILAKKFWEFIGKPKLMWSPIQFKITNQYKIYPIGRLEKVEVNINGVETKFDFEVIEIMDDSYPYLALIGIDSAFDNNAIFNLKQRNILFEIDTLRVTSLLDITKGDIYNQPLNKDIKSSIIDNIYNITGWKEDYVNPTVDGKKIWRSIFSYDIDSKDVLTRWKNSMYEVLTRRCA